MLGEHFYSINESDSCIGNENIEVHENGKESINQHKYSFEGDDKQNLERQNYQNHTEGNKKNSDHSKVLNIGNTRNTPTNKAYCNTRLKNQLKNVLDCNDCKEFNNKGIKNKFDLKRTNNRLKCSEENQVEDKQVTEDTTHIGENEGEKIGIDDEEMKYIEVTRNAINERKLGEEEIATLIKKKEEQEVENDILEDRHKGNDEQMRQVLKKKEMTEHKRSELASQENKLCTIKNEILQSGQLMKQVQENEINVRESHREYKRIKAYILNETEKCKRDLEYLVQNSKEQANQEYVTQLNQIKHESEIQNRKYLEVLEDAQKKIKILSDENNKLRQQLCQKNDFQSELKECRKLLELSKTSTDEKFVDIENTLQDLQNKQQFLSQKLQLSGEIKVFEKECITAVGEGVGAKELIDKLEKGNDEAKQLAIELETETDVAKDLVKKLEECKDAFHHLNENLVKERNELQKMVIKVRMDIDEIKDFVTTLVKEKNEAKLLLASITELQKFQRQAILNNMTHQLVEGKQNGNVRRITQHERSEESIKHDGHTQENMEKLRTPKMLSQINNDDLEEIAKTGKLLKHVNIREESKFKPHFNEMAREKCTNSSEGIDEKPPTNIKSHKIVKNGTLRHEQQETQKIRPDIIKENTKYKSKGKKVANTKRGVTNKSASEKTDKTFRALHKEKRFKNTSNGTDRNKKEEYISEVTGHAKAMEKEQQKKFEEYLKYFCSRPCRTKSPVSEESPKLKQILENPPPLTSPFVHPKRQRKSSDS